MLLDIVLSVFIIALIVLMIVVYKEEIMKLIRAKVIEVEKNFSNLSGKDKLERALKIVNKATLILKYFVPNSFIIKWIQRAVSEFNRFSK